MIEKILKCIKDIEGNVITIGVNEDKIMKKLLKNAKINLFDIHEYSGNSVFKKRNKKKLNSEKIINIKKLNKYFNKKSINYMICNIDEINDYLKFFVKNSIYVNNNKLIIYGSTKNTDIDIIKKRYNRYKVNIEEFYNDSDFVLIIDNSLSKNKKIMEFLYYIKDSLYNLIDFISNILIS